ncbi:MAG: hypothetical protein H8F28_20540 [Fibrella sp.]|nr:hypothetical protein [Armatimonadota bacterium]
MHGRVFILLEMLVFLTCFSAPIASLWLAPDWAGVVALLSLFVASRVRVSVFLSLGEFLIVVSALSTLLIWFIRIASNSH